MTKSPVSTSKELRGIPKLVALFDVFQQKHRFLGFPFAVIKKYGEDTGGYHAALLTYYGFLSLFPLLLVFVTIFQLWFKNDTGFQQRVTETINTYLPVIGSELQENIHRIGGAPWALAIGILVAIYGARGGADAIRFMLNNIWQVPKNRRAGFPKSLLYSLSIMAGTAVGFLTMIGVSSFSAQFGHALWVKVVANLLGFAVAFLTILFVFYRATGRKVPVKEMIPGTLFAAVAIQLLITFGGLFVAHQLKNFNAVYGTFAVVLGLLFWIYLVAQIIVFAVEIDSVRHLKLWPRAVQNDKPTKADHEAYELYAHVQRFIPQEEVDVRFRH